jgi:hypothetical protein
MDVESVRAARREFEEYAVRARRMVFYPSPSGGTTDGTTDELGDPDSGALDSIVTSPLARVKARLTERALVHFVFDQIKWRASVVNANCSVLALTNPPLGARVDLAVVSDSGEVIQSEELDRLDAKFAKELEDEAEGKAKKAEPEASCRCTEQA